MCIRDRYKDLDFGKTGSQALDLTDVTATSNGNTIDLQGKGGCLFLLNAHDLNSGTFTFHLEDSDDNSTFTDVDASYVSESANSVAFADTEDNSVKQIGYHGIERYVRCVCVATSPVGTNNLSAIAVVADNYGS